MENDDDKRLAQAADAALGNRNRRAVLSMDGNDMGCQFREFEKSKPDDAAKKKWMTEMSANLRYCTRNAFCDGLIRAITLWWEEAKADADLIFSFERASTYVLPFRPLILGGDDILCLCHCSFALSMARTIIDRFEKISRELNGDYKKNHPSSNDLWPGTSGKLTISAGIAYTGITLPLSLSIPYAENLLGSAKGKYRKEKGEKEPTPAAVDWESITETMIDSPADRRRRDLTFIDKDINTEIILTQRPFRIDPKENEITLDDVKRLKEELEKMPRSVLTDLMTVLTLPWGERVARLAAMAVQNPKILDWLDEGINAKEKFGSCWKIQQNGEKTIRSNWFLDALMLLEEEKRMGKETIQ
ncbi:MAG: hypothetical protein Q4G69_11525 [Planctomycetia bacterium]|nr:hypothetical protein [Planctomycetia bacterium]